MDGSGIDAKAGGFPVPIPLTEQHQRALKRLAQQSEGVQQFLQNVTISGEERFKELKRQGQDIYRDIAAQYGIDIENVMWAPSPDFKTLIPVSVRLSNGTPPQS